MFREYEFLLWVSFCQPNKIKSIIEQVNSANLLEKPEVLQLEIVKKIINHLLNTAYYTKSLVTPQERFTSFKEFFNQEFQIFEGKHTDWLLLNEPDAQAVTVQTINSKFKQLKKTFYQSIDHLRVKNKDLTKTGDYNKIVRKLNEEAEKNKTTELSRKQQKIKRKAMIKEAKFVNNSITFSQQASLDKQVDQDPVPYNNPSASNQSTHVGYCNCDNDRQNALQQQPSTNGLSQGTFGINGNSPKAQMQWQNHPYFISNNSRTNGYQQMSKNSLFGDLGRATFNNPVPSGSISNPYQSQAFAQQISMQMKSSPTERNFRQNSGIFAQYYGQSGQPQQATIFVPLNQQIQQNDGTSNTIEDTFAGANAQRRLGLSINLNPMFTNSKVYGNNQFDSQAQDQNPSVDDLLRPNPVNNNTNTAADNLGENLHYQNMQTSIYDMKELINNLNNENNDIANGANNGPYNPAGSSSVTQKFNNSFLVGDFENKNQQQVVGSNFNQDFRQASLLNILRPPTQQQTSIGQQFASPSLADIQRIPSLTQTQKFNSILHQQQLFNMHAHQNFDLQQDSQFGQHSRQSSFTRNIGIYRQKKQPTIVSNLKPIIASKKNTESPPVAISPPTINDQALNSGDNKINKEI